MDSLILNVAAATLVYLGLRLFYKRVVRPPFSNIAGPPAGTLLSGALSVSLLPYMTREVLTRDSRKRQAIIRA